MRLANHAHVAMARFRDSRRSYNGKSSNDASVAWSIVASTPEPSTVVVSSPGPACAPASPMDTSASSSSVSICPPAAAGVCMTFSTNSTSSGSLMRPLARSSPAFSCASNVASASAGYTRRFCQMDSTRRALGATSPQSCPMRRMMNGTTSRKPERNAVPCRALRCATSLARYNSDSSLVGSTVCTTSAHAWAVRDTSDSGQKKSPITHSTACIHLCSPRCFVRCGCVCACLSVWCSRAPLTRTQAAACR